MFVGVDIANSFFAYNLFNVGLLKMQVNAIKIIKCRDIFKE